MFDHSKINSQVKYVIIDTFQFRSDKVADGSVLEYFRARGTRDRGNIRILTETVLYSSLI